MSLPSDEIYLLHRLDTALRLPPGSCFPLLVGLCRIWQCQFLLCHHSGLEPRAFRHRGRLDIRRAAGRVRGRKTRHEGQADQACLIETQDVARSLWGRLGRVPIRRRGISGGYPRGRPRCQSFREYHISGLLGLPTPEHGGPRRITIRRVPGQTRRQCLAASAAQRTTQHPTRIYGRSRDRCRWPSRRSTWPFQRQTSCPHPPSSSATSFQARIHAGVRSDESRSNR